MTVTIVGLGPAGLDRVLPAARAALESVPGTVVVRTVDHPAAAELAELREVVTCDDIYEEASDFDALYQAVADRVLAVAGPVVYAVPGSALVGERTVKLLRAGAEAVGRDVIMHPGESFLDLALARVGIDPIADGLQVLDARSLPDPMPLHLPSIFTQVDSAMVAADLAAELGRVLEHDTAVTLLTNLGAGNEMVATTTLRDLANADVGPRTSVVLEAQLVGWVGLVHTNRVLRDECPWDRKQTHHTLLKHLIEEAYETVDAISELATTAPAGDVDFGAYADVEEELGDLMLQVVFHATLASEAGAFDVEEVAEGIRRKLVERHPHVFGDFVAADAAAVVSNWERLKSKEKRRASMMDDIPGSLPSLPRAYKVQQRAAAVGFDWSETPPVIAKLREELAELDEAIAAGGERAGLELGDLMFAAVNLARHLDVDAELALRHATARFETRFRWMEAESAGTALASMTLEQLDDLWDRAKRAVDGA